MWADGSTDIGKFRCNLSKVLWGLMNYQPSFNDNILQVAHYFYFVIFPVKWSLPPQILISPVKIIRHLIPCGVMSLQCKIFCHSL